MIVEVVVVVGMAEVVVVVAAIGDHHLGDQDEDWDSDIVWVGDSEVQNRLERVFDK